MVKGCLCVENMGHFYRTNNGPSMDRNWRGSIPQSSRYRAARNRYRLDLYKATYSTLYPNDSIIVRSVWWNVFLPSNWRNLFATSLFGYNKVLPYTDFSLILII